jgi:two-component system, NtrC family, sensor kinase
MADERPVQHVEAALRERVKELTCLYGICQIAAKPNKSLDEVLQDVVELFPPAWQYPEITCGRITVDDREYVTPGFRDGPHCQAADLIVSGSNAGRIEVIYTEDRPELDEGPFLAEERNLINAVARHVAMLIARLRVEEEKAELQGQLRQADRLSTIGMFAVGVAHELNEPLGNIMGFAQLAKKCDGLPESAQRDIGKIEDASLQAREVIKNVLAFGRRSTLERVPLDLDRVVRDGLRLLDAQCARQNVRLVRPPAADLPAIHADPTQINQVLVNLAVNALHAMPDGGRLSVRTRVAADSVVLVVEDSGTGMSPETLQRAFEPFYTTKDSGQGTGLGLVLVQSIVQSHGGRIEVDSTPGQGTRVEIEFPIAEDPEEEEA